MSVALPTLVVVLALVVALAAALVPRRSPTAPGGADDHVVTSPAALTRARRHAAVVAGVAWAALVAGMVALPSVAPSGTTGGVVLGAAPAVAGLAFLLVAAVGERTWPAPAGAVRRAALVRRTAAGVAPRGLLVTLAATGATLLVVLVATGLTAAPDGRTVALELDIDLTTAAGPYPGPPYAVPLGVGAVLVLLATLGVLHLVARRPAVPEVSPADDAALRSASAGRVLAGALLVVGGTLAGVLLTAGTALRNASTATYGVDDVVTTVRDPLTSALGVVGLGAAPLVAVGAVALTTVALVRASRTVAPASRPVA